MRNIYIASFAAAAILHAFLLFGFRLETAARPLPMSDSPSVEVDLVPAQDQPPAVETPPAPEPTPAPAVEQPEPTPAPEMEQPAPEPTPEPAMTEPNPDATPAATAAPSPRTHPASQHPRTTSAVPHHEANSLPAPGATGGVRTSVRYRSNPRPEYPAEARQLRQEGVVLLNVDVGTDGRPNDVTVKRSSGYPLLDDAAVAAVKRWMFEPASVASIPIASKVDVPVRFTLSQ